MRQKILIGLGILAAVALVVVMLVVACTPKKKPVQNTSESKITLTYWRLWDDSEVMAPLIEKYQKTHPNIQIEYKKLAFAEYERTLLEALAAGKGPDMFSIQNAWVPKYDDKIAPVPEKVYATKDYEKDFFPVAKFDSVIDNKIFSIPYSIDTLALYVNNQLFDQADINAPPKTWQELTRKTDESGKPGMLQQLNVRQGNTFSQSAIAMGNNTAVRSMDILSLLMLQFNTSMVNNEKNTAIFNLTQPVDGKEIHLGTQALDFYTSFAQPNSTTYSWNDQMGDSVQAFVQNRVAYMLGYAYQVPTLERLKPDLNYQIVPAPQPEGRDPVNFASYWTETVSKSSQHTEEAWKFIKWMSEPEQMREYNKASNTVPARRDMTAPSKLQVFYEQAPSAQSWYKGNAPKADIIFADMISQVLKGEAPQQAIDNAANRETQVLKDLQAQTDGSL